MHFSFVQKSRGAYAMAPPAELSAKRVFRSPATSQPTSTIPSFEWNQHPIPNEEVVGSENSLSHHSSQSVRNPPAGSFSNYRTPPNKEAQTSGLQGVEETELPSVPSRGNPSDSSGNNTRQPVPVGNSHHHASTTSRGLQDASRNTPQPPNQQRPCTRSFQESWHAVHQDVPTYGITSNTIALLALALPTFFGSKTYKLTQIATGAQLHQTFGDGEVR